MSFFLILLLLFSVLHLPGIRNLRVLGGTRDRAAVAAGLFFVGAGCLHFAMPGTYLPMVPSQLSRPEFWVALSGALEILGGAALLLPRHRTRASVVLAILLLAILPANAHVAARSVVLEELPFPRWYFWLRIPFQAVFIAWVLWAGGILWKPTPEAQLLGMRNRHPK